MSLSSGDKLGPYEILGPIGKGGMGEVYRARDPRLNRDVAIKVSTAQFSERFEREAKAIAALNHPNICQIYDVGLSYLVMEFIEGESPNGPMRLGDALRIARQIADALEAAHEKGIIHRDLKPGNIKVKPDGTVKVLDFGLAKIYAAPSGSEENSPTLTMGMTDAGMILGTAAYMAPEQARGKDLDKRADIWAFGVVLYEMLTGKRLFQGEDVGHTLAVVITQEPDFSAAPPQVIPLLKRCLEKDPKKRLRDIGDAFALIEADSELASLQNRAGNGASPSGPIPSRSDSRLGRISIVAAVVFALAAIWLAFLHFHEQSPAAAEPVVFQIVAPEKALINGISVSPDGRHVAFTARDASSNNYLWVRSLGVLAPRALGVQVAPGSAFWSPDSRYIGFATPGNLKLSKIEVSGGAAETICDLSGGLRGATWNPLGVIMYSTVGNFGSAPAALSYVPASGGTPSPVNQVAARFAQFNPSFLPDGQHFLYQQLGSTGDSNGIFVGSLSEKPEQTSSHRLLAADSAAVYVPPDVGDGSGMGHILFEREGTLMAQLFDPGRLELQGEAFSVERDMSGGIRPLWSASGTGVLAFENGRAEGSNTHLIWRDSQGRPVGEVGPPSNYRLMQLSFDGKRVVVTKGDEVRGGSQHTWAADLSRGIFSRVNAGDANENSPAISVDGRVAFASSSNGAAGDIYANQVNGLGMPEPWVKSDPKSRTILHPNGFSADGRFLIYDAHDPQRRQDLWVIPTSGERKPIPFLTTPADETFGQFSPDGKWIAYSSDESGRREVYVQGFAPDRSPATAVGKWQVSSAGGDKPRWSHDGKELFYLSADSKLMKVPVKSGATFEPGKAVALFDVRAAGFFPYDVSPDGRFLINTPVESDATEMPITVVLNWGG